MRSQTDYERIDIDANPRPNPWRDGLPVATVTAEGAFCVTFLDRHLVSRNKPVILGLAAVAYTPEMGVSLTQHARRSGTVLYEGLCKGRVPGIDASEPHWRLWQSVCELRAQGRDLRRGALQQAASKLGLGDKVYHPEVYRRRSLVGDGGMFSVDVDELMGFLGLDAEAGADDLFEATSKRKRG